MLIVYLSLGYIKKFVIICLTCNSMIIFLLPHFFLIYYNFLLYSHYFMLNINNIVISFSFG